jgi:glutamine synthetase
MTMAKRDALAELKKSEHQRVKVAVSDIDGVLRGKYLHRDKFLSAADSGFGFCNVVFGWDSSDVCYDNSKYTGWHTGYPDALARIDLSTLRYIPWENGQPFFLGDFDDGTGAPLAICPRQLLKRVLARASEMGYSVKCGMEFEWFNFTETPKSIAAKKYVDPEPLTPGMYGYSLLRSSQNQNFFDALLTNLNGFGIPIEGLHTETGPGVYEAAILYSEALEAADRATLFKTSVKQIAYPLGILPSFMAKWNNQLPGCSGHVHLSLWKGDKNIFHDDKDPNKMSPTFKSFLAGQLHSLTDVLPFFAPNVNSYKRLVDGFWAPTKSTWGIDNRTVAFRVIPGSSKSTRVEVRISGSDVNPYLSIAAAIATGLYGIEKKLALKDAPIKGSAYQESKLDRLPRNLGESSENLKKSRLARELFGEEFVSHFAATRDWEWRQYQNAVTNWELQRYFEIT